MKPNSAQDATQIPTKLFIAEALDLLNKSDQYQEWNEEIGRKIDVAAQQLDRGEGIDGESASTQLRRKLQKIVPIYAAYR